jgi:hypothetical protein
MKLKRGQKRCKKCQAINAARQRVCISCNQTFQLKNTPIKNEIKDWKNLQQGDTFRIVNGTGSYYILTRNCSEGEAGDKLFMGSKGKYIVQEVMENGIHAWSISSPGNRSHEFVYMGKDDFCEKLSLHRRAHRLVKIKHKNKYKMY